MKKLFLILLMISLPMVSSADAVEIDGIYYNFITKQQNFAEVTHGNWDLSDVRNDDRYSGNVVIPEFVVHEGITYPVKSIGSQAFKYCNNLSSVIIPNSITTISSYAFACCYNLTSLIIPESVTSIGDCAFLFCSSLSSINIPSSVTTIKDYVFSGCSNLTTITIPNCVTEICRGAFYDCKSLTSIVFSTSVTKIGDHAFYDCTNLTSINLPNCIKEINESAFSGCGLTSITIPNSLITIDKYVFSRCTSLTSITISNSVKTIDTYAFYGCSSLTSIDIGNSVTHIGFYAFSNCSNLQTIFIGYSIVSIKSYAFEYCPEISDVYCYAPIVPSTGEDIFRNSYIEYATLHVPANSIGEYNVAKQWQDFGKIISLQMPKHLLTYLIDGNIYRSYSIEEGEVIIPEPEPTKEGYTFSGWSEIPETMPAHDVTVTGTFIINKYKLTYNVDGEEYKSYEVEYGANITPEAEPTKEGYTFSGWSELPETMPAHDVTVTGTLSVNCYKLTYIIDDKVYKETMYEYGATITPEPQPEGDYDTFEWKDLPETMPAHDVVVYASYTSGILEILMASHQNVRIYSPNGKKLNKLQKGLNIVILDDGTVKKVIMK